MDRSIKKVIAIILSLVMVFSYTCIVSAEEPVEKPTNTISYSFSSGTLSFTGIGEVDSSYANDINIESIKVVIIEPGAISISDNAFENCINLEKIDIPYTVTSIGIDAFKNVSVEFEASVHEESAAIDCCKENGIKIKLVNHTLTAGEFLWSNNCKKCAVSFTCDVCKKEDILRTCIVKDKVTLKPTCKEKGTTEYTATYKTLSEKKTVQDIDLVDHNWDTVNYVIDEPANCTNGGIKSFHCMVCDIVKPGSEVVIPGDGKSHVFETITKKPANHQYGYTYDKCEVCGYKTPTEYIPYNSKNYVSSFKVTAGSGSFTAKWKKQTSTKFDGYIITYSKYSNMKASKSVKVSRTASSKKISKLSKKKKYYVEICSYEIYKNNIYLSKATKTTVTTK